VFLFAGIMHSVYRKSHPAEVFLLMYFPFDDFFFVFYFRNRQSINFFKGIISNSDKIILVFEALRNPCYN